MSDLNMNFEKLNKACKEVNEKWGNMMKENNPFDTISKIAKDIQDREDREMALAFTNAVCSLLKENGVVVKTSRYELETDNEADKNKYIIKKEYGVSFDGLDFTEHDKRFKDEIRKLKHELEEKCRFETDRLVKLPFDALETANMLINATYSRKTSNVEKAFTRNKAEKKDIYSIDDLEQIAEHFLV